MPLPNVSVVIATYNGEKYIQDQLCSILNQIDESTEIIISDNGSTDNTLQIINRFKDHRIKLVYNHDKKGSTYNFEHAILQASGEIIFLSDQDDVWLENKFKTCLEWLKKYDVVVTNCKIVDDNLNILHESYFHLNKSGKGIVKNLVRNSYVGCCMAVKRKVLKTAIPFPNGIAKYYMHDVWIGFVTGLFFKSYFVDTPLLLYRRHQGTLSVAGKTSPFNLWEKINFRWQIIKNFRLLLYRYFIRKNV